MVPAKDAAAFFTYGMQVSYQQNDVNSSTATTSTSQERFSFYFNTQSAPFSRLTMVGVLRLDVLQDNRADGTSSTELQPNVDIRLSMRAVQFGGGYRQIIRNENIIAGNITQALTSNSTDSYLETNIVAGRLPSLRLRYSIRDESQNREGVIIANTNTTDFLASTNYRLGIFLLNADYRDQQTKDKIGNVTSDSKQVNGQVSFSRKVGDKIDVGLRENYSLTQTDASNAATARQSTSAAEARANINLFRGAVISSSYIYRISDDITTGSTTERTLATSASYSLPRYIRFYGSYVTRESDSTATTNSSDNTVAGVTFNHSVGRLSFASRYEVRFDTTTITTGPASSKTTTTQDLLDWALTVRPARYLGLLLSESYVSNKSNGVTTDTNHFRLRADIGPVKALTLGPYVEYTLTSGTGGTVSTTSTAYVVPAAFHVNLHRKLDFSITDTYNLNITETSGSPSTRSQNNNAVLRLALARPIPNSSVAMDASFTTASTDTSPTTSTSTYVLRAGWSKYPHILNFNAGYQTVSNGNDTISFAGQYVLNFRLKKLAMAFQARYDYSKILTTPSSTSQTIYVLLNLRK
jgi:hypothetical protein